MRVKRGKMIKVVTATCIVVVNSLALIGCGSDSSSGSASSNVLYTQLKTNYSPQVQYEPENREEIEELVDILGQAYINGEEDFESILEEYDATDIEVSEQVKQEFINISKEYELSSSYDTVEDMKEEYLDEGYEYRVGSETDFARDCLIVRYDVESVSHLYKMVINDGRIESITEYGYALD